LHETCNKNFFCVTTTKNNTNNFFEQWCS
jgi:hypothetical protein